MKTFKQFISEASVKYIGKPKAKCYKVIPYKMAPGGKACAMRSHSSARD